MSNRLWGFSLNPVDYIANAAHNMSGGMLGYDADLHTSVSKQGGVRNPVGPTLGGVGSQPNIAPSTTSKSEPVKKAVDPRPTSSPDPQVQAYNAAVSAAAAKEAKEKADAIAAYEEQIRQNQSALNRLGNQQRIGESNILDSYNAARRDNQSNFNQSTGMYNMRTNDAIDAFGRRRDEIESNAADQTRSARGIFAAGGAGDSSFAHVLAPFKIAEAASRVQGDEHDTYARNRRDMDINYTAVKNAYNKNKKQFDVDQANDLNALRQKIRTSRADLQDTIRNLNAQKAVASGSIDILVLL